MNWQRQQGAHSAGSLGGIVATVKAFFCWGRDQEAAGGGGLYLARLRQTNQRKPAPEKNRRTKHELRHKNLTVKKEGQRERGVGKWARDRGAQTQTHAQERATAGAVPHNTTHHTTRARTLFPGNALLLNLPLAEDTLEASALFFLPPPELGPMAEVESCTHERSLLRQRQHTPTIQYRDRDFSCNFHAKAADYTTYSAEYC